MNNKIELKSPSNRIYLLIKDQFEKKNNILKQKIKHQKNQTFHVLQSLRNMDQLQVVQECRSIIKPKIVKNIIYSHILTKNTTNKKIIKIKEKQIIIKLFQIQKEFNFVEPKSKIQKKNNSLQFPILQKKTEKCIRTQQTFLQKSARDNIKQNKNFDMYIRTLNKRIYQ